MSTSSLLRLKMFAVFATAAAAEPQVVLLWPNDAPGSEGKTGEETVRVSPQGDHIVAGIHHPSITAYLPNLTGMLLIAVLVAAAATAAGTWLASWLHRETESLIVTVAAGIFLLSFLRR